MRSVGGHLLEYSGQPSKYPPVATGPENLSPGRIGGGGINVGGITVPQGSGGVIESELVLHVGIHLPQLLIVIGVSGLVAHLGEYRAGHVKRVNPGQLADRPRIDPSIQAVGQGRELGHSGVQSGQIQIGPATAKAVCIEISFRPGLPLIRGGPSKRPVDVGMVDQDAGGALVASVISRTRPAGIADGIVGNPVIICASHGLRDAAGIRPGILR